MPQTRICVFTVTGGTQASRRVRATHCKRTRCESMRTRVSGTTSGRRMRRGGGRESRLVPVVTITITAVTASSLHRGGRGTQSSGWSIHMGGYVLSCTKPVCVV